jgi:hypothetical protein
MREVKLDHERSQTSNGSIVLSKLNTSKHMFSDLKLTHEPVDHVVVYLELHIYLLDLLL